MPYPNEHAARLRDPKRYERFRRENNKFGAGVHAIWGIRQGKVELQAIRFQASKWTVARARKWLKDHNYKPILFEEASGKGKQREARVFRGAAGGGELRTAQFEGRKHLVVPVVALVEGVIHAANSETPELVLAEEFARAPVAWNGRPVMYDHPQVDGEHVPANSPRVLEALRLGYVFNARLDADRLRVEAWVDPERAREVGEGAARLVHAIEAGETVEVSVGVIVEAEPVSGERNGQHYDAVWREVIPDHVALLPEGKVGACSVDMGCGASRAAATGGGEGDMTRSGFLAKLKETFESAVRSVVADAPPDVEEQERLVERAARLGVPWERTEALLRPLADDGTSDVELRRALEDALHSTEPAFLGVVEVYPDAAKVIYAVSPEGDVKFYRRGYELAADGAVTLKDDAEEGRWTQTFELITASAAPVGRDGQASTTAPASEGGISMDKKQKVAAIIASGKTCFVAADAAVLEQLPDERITALEAHVAAQAATPPAAEAKPPEEPPKEEQPKAEAEPLTEEKVLAAFPDLKKIVDDHRTTATNRKAALVAQLKDAAKAAYTEDELKAMPVEQLEKIAALTSKPKADFAPLAPREGGEERPQSSDELRAAMRERLKVVRPA